MPYEQVQTVQDQLHLSVGQVEPALPYIRPAPIQMRSRLWWEHLKQMRIWSFYQDWSRRCSFCNIPLLSSERDGWCCNRGQRQLPSLPQCDLLLQQLLDLHQGRVSQMSRRLNNLFAFSAIGTTGRFVPFRGLANVVLEGRVYHRLLDIAEEGHSMHWFLYDEAARFMQAREQSVPQGTVEIIRHFLEQVSPYVRNLRHAVTQVNDEALPLAIELAVPAAGGDIAAIINTDSLRHVNPRKVVFFRHSGLQPQFVAILSAQYEPLQYPLLFPHGTPGWGYFGDGQKNLSCTQIQWYRHLFLTEPRFQILGRLASEYAVDMFSRTEEQRLTYLQKGRRFQATTMDEAPNPTVPDLFENKIPASFMGSRAWASDQVADALAIARHLGKPSIWLTMTTNPQWPEIQSQLLQGQDVSDIPAVVCRAFHGRLQALKAFLRKHFGGLVYEISVIEFQKRGLPHAHVVIKSNQETPLSMIDCLISAELPDPDEKPMLYQQIKHFHMHSPDHLSRIGSRCNRNGRCIYDYPQPITPHTYLDDLGRVHYRRRAEEDRWVTPHIPALLELLDCHIYVDVCSTAIIFLYLFKYLFKGPDQAKFSLDSLGSATGEEEVIDEYKDYISGRYLSASEAVYRIFNFDTVYKNPSVRCLSIHLEGKNLASIRDRNAPGYSETSDLLWYFQRPTTEAFQQLTYMDFFSRYYFETLPLDDPLDKGQIPLMQVETERGIRQKVIRSRLRGIVITRLQTVPVRLKELFYLRALLQIRPASSFQDLRLIHGHLYGTYHEAATALGLFQDIREAEYALTEAITAYSSPSQLRFLFAYLLLDLPFPAIELWSRFWQDLCADYLLQHHPDQATNLALENIARYLASQGSSLRQCGLPEPEHHRHDAEVDLELNFFHPHHAILQSRADAAYARMIPDQQNIFDHIQHLPDYTIRRPQGSCFFIDGRAGRGKTFLMAALCDRIRGDGGIACITGTTALSVVHYERGRTAHSAFGIPVQESDMGLESKIGPHSARAELLRQAHLIIWEELPMARKAVLECANQLLQDIMGNQLPFGGKTFVGLGDFRQVAPVVRGCSGPSATLNSSIRSSYLWSHFKILRLTVPIRYAGDPVYAQWVDQVGDGLPPYEATVDLKHLEHLDDMEAAARFLFLDESLATSEAAVRRAFLSPFNARVDIFNQLMLDTISGTASTTCFS
jgi:hypothetical protein